MLIIISVFVGAAVVVVVFGIFNGAARPGLVRRWGRFKVRARRHLRR